MRQELRIPVGDVVPPVVAVLKAQAIPEGVTPDERISRLAEEAIATYRTLADPVGILMDVSRDEFETVYRGEGRNADETPLDRIRPSADSLALFVVTIGEKMCEEITRLFDVREFAPGSMLDAAASEGAELAAQAVELSYRQHLHERGRLDSDTGTLQFSPGYCGWHISAQRKLFDILHPEEIGITLNPSFLMHPLKSISGVIIAGPKEIFAFDDDFPFCAECRTHSCQDRLSAVLRQ
ncbi:MAG TPA: vitamin B12 dependent-methionine synthase activation domain-containing protein [Acidobacteriota bacterium]|nr:vitamin B12 dependent-methionine synthase activation domain-containing protein [Acidobacteriota bacterium]